MEISATVYREDTFKKLSEKAIDILTEEGDALSIALFTIIVRHLNRQQNSLVASFEKLGEWAGMSAKSVQRRTALLEKLGLVQIVRRKKGNKNAPNEYRLAGIARMVACETVSPSSRTERSDTRTESPSLTYKHNNHIHDDDAIYSDSDTGEFSVESEGHDASLDNQDRDEFLEQELFLQEIGVKGDAIKHLKHHTLSHLRDAWVIAQDRAHSNPVGMFVKIATNGIFKQGNHGWGTSSKRKSQFEGITWSDFTDNNNTSQESNTTNPYEGLTLSDVVSESVDFDGELLVDSSPKLPEASDKKHYVSPDELYKTYLTLMDGVDKNTFETYVKDWKYLGSDEYGYIIGVDSAEKQDFLQHRLYRVVKQIFDGFWHRQLRTPPNFRFVVDNDFAINS